MRRSPAAILLLVALASGGCCCEKAVSRRADNSALQPVSLLERDSYDWFARHERILREGPAMNPEIVFVGDSILHFWAGRKSIGGADASACWKRSFGAFRTLNLGFGWDRIQNVLWRFEHGELEDLSPKVVVVLIGTNNTMTTPNARENTPQEIVEGVDEILARLHSAFPEAKVVLLNILPRESSPTGPLRDKVEAARRALSEFTAEKMRTEAWLVGLDVGAGFLRPDGTIPRALMGDGTHPSEKGYEIIARGLLPILHRSAE